MFEHWWELTLIIMLALLVFGPKRLPELGSSIGKGIREFRHATSDVADVASERGLADDTHIRDRE